MINPEKAYAKNFQEPQACQVSYFKPYYAEYFYILHFSLIFYPVSLQQSTACYKHVLIFQSEGKTECILIRWLHPKSTVFSIKDKSRLSRTEVKGAFLQLWTKTYDVVLKRTICWWSMQYDVVLLCSTWVLLCNTWVPNWIKEYKGQSWV